MPEISVVMPVYNGETYLQDAIDSILFQSFEDFEFIIIDDGSTDGTAGILDRAAAADPRVRVIRQQNAGIVAALNAGIDASSAPYVARMDADDIAFPDRFTMQMSFLTDRPDVVACGGAILLIDDAGRALCDMVMSTDHDEIDRVHAAGLGQMGLSHPSAMIRRTALDRIGGYDADYPSAEDVDLWLRLAEVGTLANLTAKVVMYRVHLNGTGYSKRYEQKLSAWKAARAAAERRGMAFKAPEPERTEAENSTGLPATYSRWGWWALRDGHVQTARHYSRKLLARKPIDPNAWRLFYCAMRGY